jgi:Immunoglobulin domain
VLTFLDAPQWYANAVRKFGAAEGTSCVLQCRVRAYPSVSQFYWMNGLGTNIAILGSRGYTIATGFNSSELTIQSVKRSDYGNYTCVAVNAIDVRKFHLVLLAPGNDV